MAALATILPAACADGPGDSPAAAEREFVALLLPHHHLGMLLVDEATVRSDDVRLRRLVFEMGSYHSSEIARLTDWADDWNVEPAATFPGELSSAQLSMLADTALDHDTVWLQLMIEHHEGAVEIAETYLASGRSAEVRSLASTVARVQREELARMRRLFEQLCRSVPVAAACTQ